MVGRNANESGQSWVASDMTKKASESNFALKFLAADSFVIYSEVKEVGIRSGIRVIIYVYVVKLM